MHVATQAILKRNWTIAFCDLHTLASKIAASNDHILKVHIHIDKKTFCQKNVPYNFLYNLVPRDIYHILDYI